MIVSSPLPKHVQQRARVASSSMCLCDKAEPDVTDSLVHLVHKLCQSLVDQLQRAKATRATVKERPALIHGQGLHDPSSAHAQCNITFLERTSLLYSATSLL
eukprot:6185381-Pleurochrysis_carterae.AAC.5